jgi:uncharacterized protein YraI
MKAAAKTAGFQVLTDSKYLTGYDYLLPGDILLNEAHHVCTNISTGSKAINTTASSTVESSVSSTSTSSTTYNKTEKWVGIVTATELNVRTNAGTSYSECSFSPLKKGTEISVCDSVTSDGATWYYIQYNGKYGFVHGNYIKEKADSSWTGIVTASTLNVRTWAGSENDLIKSYPQLEKGNQVRVISTIKANDGSDWYKVAINNTNTGNKDIIGFVSAQYIKRA